MSTKRDPMYTDAEPRITQPVGRFGTQAQQLERAKKGGAGARRARLNRALERRLLNGGK